MNRLWGKLKSFFHSVIRIFRDVLKKLKSTKASRQELISFLRDEKNKKTFLLITTQAKKMARHVLPRRLKGQITFGFDDPYRMGQILTGAAFLYPLYHNQFTVVPVFDRQLIEGELAFRGRIRLGVFLAAGIRILLNRNFRIQLKKFMNRGGM